MIIIHQEVKQVQPSLTKKPIKLVSKPLFVYNAQMSHISTDVHPNLIQRVKTLVIESVSLKILEKDRILQQLNGLSDKKLQQMESLFINEQKMKNEILHKKFTANPQLAKSYHQKIEDLEDKVQDQAEARTERAEQVREEILLHRNA